MCITADRSDALKPEIEGINQKSCPFKEWHNEAAQAAINMQTNLVLLRQS